jgi:hypothetical protein
MSTVKLMDDPDLQAVSTRIAPMSLVKLIDDNPTMRPVVVDGILRRGETINIIASAKVGKSHLAGGLAWSLASGTPWLSHDVSKGRVLIIDNELHPETLANRMYRIAMEMMIDVSIYGPSIDVIPLRGENMDINMLENRLEAIKPGYYTLAILDALYRTLPAGISENDNAQMMAVYNKLDYYASQWDCAIGVVHHASKGQQGEKSVTDVGSGAGSISRAADSHIIIRPHEQPHLSVMECVTRSFKSPDPISVRFDWPLWSAVACEPEVKKSGVRQTQATEATQLKNEVLKVLTDAGRPLRQCELLGQFEYGEPKLLKIFNQMAVKDKTIKRVSKVKKGTKIKAVYWQALTHPIT